MSPIDGNGGADSHEHYSVPATLSRRGPDPAIQLAVLCRHRGKHWCGVLALPFLTGPGRTVLLLGIGPALFWLASSLLVSHYVYDRFPLYDLNWVCSVLSRAPRRWINIHCGLDETSALLAEIFPDATSQVVDIFDPRVMTEASIRAARRVTHHTIPSSSMQYDALAFPAIGSMRPSLSLRHTSCAAMINE